LERRLSERVRQVLQHRECPDIYPAEVTPPIYVAAAAPRAAELAARIGDGLISTAPNREIVDKFRAFGAPDKPRLGGFTVCVADDEVVARRKAFDHWPNAGLPGDSNKS
jgi:alkanesulfonate monooxygenase SsuD/methylene tetrahydromethanopterin reductase-like flavin-dependent oxidoreductase (luciferase family)